MTSDTESQAEQCRRSITMLDVQVLAAIDRREWTTADRLDRQRNKLRRMLAAFHDEKAAGFARTLASTGATECRSYITHHKAQAAQLRKDAAS